MSSRSHFLPQQHLIYRPMGFQQQRVFSSHQVQNTPAVSQTQSYTNSPISQVYQPEPRRMNTSYVYSSNMSRTPSQLPKAAEQQEHRHVQMQPNVAVQVNYDLEKSRHQSNTHPTVYNQNPHPQQVQITYLQRGRQGSDDMTMSKTFKQNTAVPQAVQPEQRVGVAQPTRTVLVTKTVSGSPFSGQFEKSPCVFIKAPLTYPRNVGVHQQLAQHPQIATAVKNDGHSPTITTFSAGSSTTPNTPNTPENNKFTVRFAYQQPSTERANRLDHFKTLTYSELVSRRQTDPGDKVAVSRYSEGAEIRSDYQSSIFELNQRAPLTVSMIVGKDEETNEEDKQQEAREKKRSSTMGDITKEEILEGSQVRNNSLLDEKNQLEADAFKKDKGSSLEPYKPTQYSKFSPQNAPIRKQTQLNKIRFIPTSHQQRPQNPKSNNSLNLLNFKITNPSTSTLAPSNFSNQSPIKKEQVQLPSPVKKPLQSPPRKSSRKAPKLDDFILGRKLGKGKYGDVYMVEHKLLGFVCAMKTVEKKLMKEENVEHQFIREIKLQSYLRHQNIVQLYGYFDDDKNVYLLLELCEEGHLIGILRKKKRLSEAETAGFVSQICNGVDFMHRHRIIHRDLKPENIILQNGSVKICDFGWAVDISDGLRSTFCGTPLYVSPDVLRGDLYDEKIDLWAIGVLTYELLVGKVPFKIVCESDLQKILYDEITFPEYLKVSDIAKDFIINLMHKDPQQRMDMDEVKNHPFLRQTQKKLNESARKTRA